MGESVTVVVPARVGLVGNPSDGHRGAVVAAPFDQRAATVSVGPANEMVIVGPGLEHRWSSLEDFVESVTTAGHPASQRILTAALRCMTDHVATRSGHPRAVRLEWTTTVPRSVGLAGSSALAVATVRALAEMWEVPIDDRVAAAIALHAEVGELGIAAGWQDRIVQAVGSPVLVDTATMETCDGYEVPVLRRLTPPQPIEVVVGWLDSAASSSGTYHGTLHQRADSLTEPMVQLGDLARTAAEAVDAGDVAQLAHLVDSTWRLRQSVAPLRPDHAALVEAVRSRGVAATTPGSGGAVVAVPVDTAAMTAATTALADHGATWCRARIDEAAI
jgi:glucuronokinase